METRDVGELYVIAMNEQARLISLTPAYLKLVQLLIPIPGVGTSVYELLEDGDDAMQAIVERQEKLIIEFTDHKEKALEILNNLNTKSNMGWGFTLDEYNSLVEFTIVTHWRCHNGQLVDSSDLKFSEGKPNKEQLSIMEYIFEYPWLLTLLLLEGQSISFVKE